MTSQNKQTTDIKKISGAILVTLIMYATPQINAQEPVTVNSDNSVTITYIDPKAKKIEVQGSFFKKGSSIIPMAGMFSKDGKAEMTNIGDCIWTYTSPLLGNVELAAARGDDPNNSNVEPSGNNMSSMFGKFEKSFVLEIVTYVDKNYKTITDKQHRAIAGLSLGGLHTLYTSLNNPNEFHYVGLFSAQTTNALGDKSIGGLKRIGEGWKRLKEVLPFLGGGSVDRKISNITEGEFDPNLDIYDNFDWKLKNFFKKNPNLFYIAVGKDDFTKKLNDDLKKNLTRGDILSYIMNPMADTLGATGESILWIIFPDCLGID